MRANDARDNLKSKLSGQTHSRKMTRTCVPWMVARLGLHWTAASLRSQVTPIVQSMVVQHNIGGIESHDQYEELCKVNPRMEFVLKFSNNIRRPTTRTPRLFVTGPESLSWSFSRILRIRTGRSTMSNGKSLEHQEVHPS